MTIASSFSHSSFGPCRFEIARLIHTPVPPVGNFRACQRADWKIPFHAFALSEEREVKIVISSIQSYTDPDTIEEKLETMECTPASVPLLLTRDKFPVNSFLIKLGKRGSFETVHTLKSFLYLRVQVCSFNAQPDPRSVTASSSTGIVLPSATCRPVVCTVEKNTVEALPIIARFQPSAAFTLAVTQRITVAVRLLKRP